MFSEGIKKIAAQVGQENKAAAEHDVCLKELEKIKSELYFVVEMDYSRKDAVHAGWKQMTFYGTEDQFKALLALDSNFHIITFKALLCTSSLEQAKHAANMSIEKISSVKKASKYSWYFEEDDSYGEGKGPIHPVSGPSGSTRLKEEIKRDGKKFRLLDDDKNIYGYGWIVGDYDGFEPLDDYGTPGLGATEIQYQNNGRWETL